MMKFILGAIPVVFLWSCNQADNNNGSKPAETTTIQKDSSSSGNIYWYKAQVIEQVIKETDSVYVIQIGMRAQSFRLERQNNDHFKQNLDLLKESISQQKKLDIGIENGTGRIITVQGN